jgi:hypothetical protein
VSQEVRLFIAGAVLALAGSLTITLLHYWLAPGNDEEKIEGKNELWAREKTVLEAKSLEDVKRITILLIMLPFNPFLLLGKTLGLGYATGTGLYYLVLQSCWYITLIALLGDVGWLLVGFAVGLHLSAIVLGWEFYFREA